MRLPNSSCFRLWQKGRISLLCFCNSIYISNHPHSDWCWERIAFRVNILPLEGRLLAARRELHRPSSKRREILPSSPGAPRDADMRTKSSQGRLSQVLSTKPKPSQVSSLWGNLQGSGSSPALSFVVSHRCAALFPPQPQIPPSGTVSSACTFPNKPGYRPSPFSWNGDSIKSRFPKWSVHASVCNCLTCAANNTWNWKRSWVIFLAALITLLYWHQLVLYWSTPSGPKSNLLFTVYLPAVYFQYFSELVEWEKAGLLHF